MGPSLTGTRSLQGRRGARPLRETGVERQGPLSKFECGEYELLKRSFRTRMVGVDQGMGYRHAELVHRDCRSLRS